MPVVHCSSAGEGTMQRALMMGLGGGEDADGMLVDAPPGIGSMDCVALYKMSRKALTKQPGLLCVQKSVHGCHVMGRRMKSHDMLVIDELNM